TAAPDGVVNAHKGRAHEAATGGDQRSAAQTRISPSECKLLAAMPLHAITALHGEAGLRERLAMEAEAYADADRDRITGALDLAARLHAADRRQRESYLSHYADLPIMPTRVVELLVAAA